MPRTIDVHNHYYPPEYVAELEKNPGVARVEWPAGESDPILAYEGDYNILVPGHRDIEARLAAMDEAGMDMHVLSLTTPGVHVEDPERGIHLAQVTNDSFAATCRKYPDRFLAFAALPLQAPEQAAAELRRCVTEHGFVGGTVFSNANGRYLDHPDFEPLHAAAAELGVPLFVHPTTPAYAEPYLDYRLVALIGFLIDTTTTISRMILGGVFDRYPDLRLIAGHLGGTLPYLQERLDRGWAVYPETQAAVQRKPSAYLRDNVYYDAVAFDRDALTLARSFAGSDHIMLGSDFPHQVGDMKKSIATVSGLDWPEDEREAVLHGNAARIFGAPHMD